jgi:hypothetical protein
MKKFMYPIAAIALVGFYAGTASAQCEFNVLAKAKGLKTSMVRAQAPCPSTEGGGTINSSTQGGTPACTTVARHVGGSTSDYLFSPKGGCSVQTLGKLVKDCSAVTDQAGLPISGVPIGPCHVVYVKSKCKGILQSDGETPINSNDDPGWSLATLTRATMDDPTNGDVTVIDFPVTFNFPAPDNGKLNMSANSVEALADAIDGAAASLPPCTSIEIVDLVIKDAAGLPFARMGGSTLPK